MSELSRRQFFSFLVVKAAESTQNALVSVARTTRVLEPRPRGSAKCARCFAPFDPVTDQLLCATCRDIEAKQQALIAGILPT